MCKAKTTSETVSASTAPACEAPSDGKRRLGGTNAGFIKHMSLQAMAPSDTAEERVLVRSQDFFELQLADEEGVPAPGAGSQGHFRRLRADKTSKLPTRTNPSVLFVHTGRKSGFGSDHLLRKGKD